MRLGDEDAEAIRASFRAVCVDARGAAESFYRHLFEVAPATRRLFIADMDRQGVKLINTLAVVVAQIQNWGALAPMVEDLALRHLAYGVQPDHYAVVGVALRKMLAERLGAQWTPAIDTAWARAYAAIAAAMVAEAYAPEDVDFEP